MSSFKTMEWVDGSLLLLDQTKLPHREEIVVCSSLEDVCMAIKEMVVRGAPAIGCAAAFGYLLGIKALLKNQKHKNITYKNHYDILSEGRKTIYQALHKTRPTAVNLEWALKQMQLVNWEDQELINDYEEKVEARAISLLQQDIDTNLKIGEIGANFLGNCSCVLTHCNAGGLATGGYGTALGVIRSIKNRGIDIEVFATETRPLLQGARLTAWELAKDSIQVTLITDGMCGALMRTRKIDAVLVGADRITANGDVVNKIGTYSISVLAKESGVPFYAVAPWSTIDLHTSQGDDVEIEERDVKEVMGFGGNIWTQQELKIFNPAFDVTPEKYISGIITEKGVIRNSRELLDRS